MILVLARMSHLKIAVIGGGPAGCLLAKILLQNDIDVTVFEGDESEDARPQGHLLGIHDGVQPIYDAGLGEEFQKICYFPERVIQDRHGHEIVRITPAKAASIASWRSKPESASGKEGAKIASWQRPAVARREFRKMLLHSLPEERVKWNHHLQSIEDNNTLVFRGQTSPLGPFDLIVGADGAWSRTRKVVSSDMPIYSGISGIFGELSKEALEKAPETKKMFGSTIRLTPGDFKAVFGAPLRQEDVWMGMMVAAPEEQLRDSVTTDNELDKVSIMSLFFCEELCASGLTLKLCVDISIWQTWVLMMPLADVSVCIAYHCVYLPTLTSNLTSIQEKVTKVFEDWHPAFHQAIENASKLTFRSLYMMPPGWTSTLR